MKVTADKATEHLNLITEHDAYTGYFQDVCKTAIEALEKQIPKKLTIVNETMNCPVCGNKIGHKAGSLILGKSDYCKHCGQALDWSVDNA